MLPGSISRHEFERRFRNLIILAWILPPIIGLSFLLFIRMFSLDQMADVLTSPLEPTFILGSLVAAVIYFSHFIKPIGQYLEEATEAWSEQSLRRLRAFPFHFWGVFLLYLLVAPSTVILSAEFYSDFAASPVDWFRIHLVALIVSIIVGLPIFFTFLDLLGRALGELRLEKPAITIRTKVFLIGALVPLLVDTMLVQYYWTRTGYFTLETFGIWTFLQILAVAGSLMFVKSFGQSLSPLENVVSGKLSLTDLPAIRATSTDELGVLSGRYQSLLEHLYLRRKALEVGNRFLRGGEAGINIGEAYDQVVEICREALGVDIAFLVLQDSESGDLVGVSLTGEHYCNTGHFRLVFSEPSLAVRVFRERQLIAVDDVRKETELNTRIVDQFNIKSAIAAPLEAENRVVGVLVAATQNQLYHFTSRDSDLIALLAREAAAIVLTQRLQLQRETAESNYREAAELARVTLQSIGDGVITTDMDGMVKFLNPIAEYLTGWQLEEAQGLPLSKVLRLIDETTGQAVADPVEQCVRGSGSFALAGKTILIAREHNKEYAVEVRVSPIRESDAQLLGVVLVFHDTTELAMLSHRLSYQASHDALTGLVNRREFEARLELALESARHDKVEHALCFMDLDQFKVVNDTCGHVAGDELLKQLGARMRATVREADTVARLGGDEFGLLLEGCHLPQARNVAESILNMLRDFRFSWEDKLFDVGMSVGVVGITADSGNIADVLSMADSACYVAKEHGRNRIHIFEPDDRLLAQRRGEMQWLQQIQYALENDRFRLFYQPIIALNQDQSTCYGEILLRLEGENELILPNAFLPTAERYHLMPEIDRWVVRHALLQLQKYSQGLGEVYFSINLSAQSLCDERFLSFVLDEMKTSGVQPDRLCFEVTETTAVTNMSRAVQFMTTLKHEGCRFALDDFGSGLSSFNYLKNLPVDYLKIDGSFVKDMDVNKIDRAMVDSINRIGHLMGMKTVAEFVSSEEVLMELKTLGVDFTQGYHVGMPGPLDEVLYSALKNQAQSSSRQS